MHKGNSVLKTLTLSIREGHIRLHISLWWSWERWYMSNIPMGSFVPCSVLGVQSIVHCSVPLGLEDAIRLLGKRCKWYIGHIDSLYTWSLWKHSHWMVKQFPLEFHLSCFAILWMYPSIIWTLVLSCTLCMGSEFDVPTFWTWILAGVHRDYPLVTLESSHCPICAPLCSFHCSWPYSRH